LSLRKIRSLSYFGVRRHSDFRGVQRKTRCHADNNHPKSGVSFRKKNFLSHEKDDRRQEAVQREYFFSSLVFFP
jgi:hypothetical protein